MGSLIVREISDSLYLLRVDDRETKRFEGMWEIPEGVTYNSYILFAGDKTVLFDGFKKSFSEKLIEAVSRLTEPSSIDYIVVHHAEPDHTGSLPLMIKESRKALVLASRTARSVLEGMYGRIERFRALGDGETLDLRGEKLRFAYTPWLHWPETAVSLLENRSVLLSCDIFGAYSTPPAVFDSEAPPDYLRSARKYFATVVGHYRAHVRRALGKIGKPKVIAPGHGLVWTKPDTITSLYEKWGSGEPQPRKATIVYFSMYGSVGSMARAAEDELRSMGWDVETFPFTDSEWSSLADMLGEAYDSEAVVFGAATYESSIPHYARMLAELIAWKTPPKKVVVLSSYGWGGVAARTLKELFASAGFAVVSVVESKGPAGEADVRSAVRKLAEP